MRLSVRGFVPFAAVSCGLAGCSTLAPLSPGRQGLLDELRARDAAGQVRPKDETPFDQPDPTADRRDSLLKSAVGVQRGWRWPLDEIVVTSGFGSRGRHFHEGLDLRASAGTPVHAIDGGQVVYAAASIRGYGRMVVVKHEGGFFSVYAHNSRLLVRRGDKIDRWQRLALSGRTGRASGPHVHFEVRKGVVPVDPMEVLPKRSLTPF